MLNFKFQNIKVEKGNIGANEVVVRGEVTNRSGRSYNTVAARIVVFVKNMAISNTVFAINGLSAGSTKQFEKVIEDLAYSQVGKDITSCEITVDSAF